MNRGREREREEVRRPWKSKEKEKEPRSTAGSPRGIMTVILQCISSCSDPDGLT